MQIKPTPLPGVMLIEAEKHSDERGSFARIFCQEEFEAAGLAFAIRQANTSFNPKPRTLRGMHFQIPPKQESKLIRCTAGHIYDVVVDLRKGSPTYCRWHGVELSWQNGLSLFIPKGCAHGFLTLMPECEVFYLMDAFYDPAGAGGVRWDDPLFAISWPEKPDVISPRDKVWADYTP